MPKQKQIKVWDPLIRLFHWTLVTAFAVTWLTEDEFLDLHVYAGYTIMLLLAIRLLWGFIGTRHARFADFVRPPREAITYLKQLLAVRAKRYLGHNPAGGLMIIALLISLLLSCISGLAIYGVEGFGPLAEPFSNYGIWDDHLLEEVHEFFANLTLALVVVHLFGVVLGSLMHRENLVRAMFNGRKPANHKG
ncbi:MAG: cytochrome b/b6 domain-containing protein [Pseudomonadota bacterium]